jgi:DNA polymerase-3 subunit gamma/tau
LRHGARVVSYAPPEFVLSGSRPVSADTLAELNTLLKTVTRTAWKVSIVDAPGKPTLRETQDAGDAAVRQAILESPIMKAAVAAFPDAQLESWPGQRSNA